MVFYCFSLGPPFQQHSVFVFVLFSEKNEWATRTAHEARKVISHLLSFSPPQENQKKKEQKLPFEVTRAPGISYSNDHLPKVDSRLDGIKKLFLKQSGQVFPSGPSEVRGRAPHHKSLFPLKLFSRLTATLVQYPFRWLSQMDAWLALFPCLVGGWRWW